MIAEDIPKWLQTHIDNVHNVGIFGPDHKPNHVLINEYQSGQGISPHLDGNLFYPTIATISLGSHTVLNFYEPISDEQKLETTCPSLEERLKFKLYLAPRSLILIKDQMFNHFLHGIEEVKSDDKTGLIFPHNHAGNQQLDRETRVSLTIRHVPKTKKIKIRL
jgi:alkylated DNA repair protein alkB family protein 6